MKARRREQLSEGPLASKYCSRPGSLYPISAERTLPTKYTESLIPLGGFLR